jgi:hypothetical protein
MSVYLFIRMTLYKKMFMGGQALDTPVFLVARSPFSSHPGPFVLQQHVAVQIEIMSVYQQYRSELGFHGTEGSKSGHD